MEISAMAQWLNTAFAGYDGAILSALHSLEEAAGTVLTPIMKLITLLGEKGLLLFLLAFVFMCFAPHRKSGICIFGAVCCGALITNIILKDWVARIRPLEAIEQFNIWWQAVGAPAEDGFSFPSGHVTAAAAGLTALCLTKGKKYIAPSVIIVILMGISRNYLMAHYPSDVLFAIIIGLASAFIAFAITKLIYKILNEHQDVPFFSFVLDWSIPIPALNSRGGNRPAGASAPRAARPIAHAKDAKPGTKAEGAHSRSTGSAGSHSSSGYQGKHLK